MNLDQWQDKINYTPYHAILEEVELLHEYENYKHGEVAWCELPDIEQMKRCTRQSGIGNKLGKLPRGDVERQPIYCNKCPACFAANALKLKGKVDGYQKRMADEGIDGQWRVRVIEAGTKEDSLKKRISRNQGGRYFKSAHDSSSNYIFTYVVNEPGKDMDKIYGEPVDINKVDYDALYRANRSMGKKFTTGKGFRTGTSPGKEDTTRIEIPQFVVERDRVDEAEVILRQTNYLELAETPEDVKRLFNFQTKYLIQELKASGIRIIAIDSKFYNFGNDALVSDWNRNVKYWMSINASSINNKEEANLDTLTSRLHQKVFGEPEVLEN